MYKTRETSNRGSQMLISQERECVETFPLLFFYLVSTGAFLASIQRNETGSLPIFVIGHDFCLSKRETSLYNQLKIRSGVETAPIHGRAQPIRLY
jgi:hypothetical protein